MVPKFMMGAMIAALTLPALTTASFADIAVASPYIRVSTSMSKSGAAFMQIENTGDMPDQLIDVRSDVAQRVELHTHKDDGNGMMTMTHVPQGFTIPAHGHHALARGGDHVMFLGLNRSLAQGDIVPVTLRFEHAGEITVDIPVDLTRTPNSDGEMDHGAMTHDKMKTSH
ncbi:hypothetical protein BFP70_16300 [Thioclava sp. SK-1]|uniref:copper chaperone PCu(A)C n=1 Tax=Thioclava sp. SK-1 TaxID=1889770 RepID=UPI0008242177|nr:copper chaperone PCu(A)C [Thioclava sp. SK-1]OCX61017.1 hypothetical protein BFP70_16300 [Thioclava sp. SK-1]